MNTETTREELERARTTLERAAAWNDLDESSESGTDRVNATDAYRAALAKHEAACEAKALRDAADEIDGLYFGPDQDMPFTTGARHKWGAMQAASRLRVRADRIEQEAK